MNKESKLRRLPVFDQRLRNLLLFLLAILPFLLPRGGASEIVPLPQVDRSALLDSFEADQLRAARAYRDPLRPNIRAVGELFRRIGSAEAHDRDALKEELQEVTRENVLLGRAEDLASLRALQSSLFYHALTTQEPSRLQKKNLQELARGFDQLENSFRNERGQLLLDALELNLLFKFRWSQITQTLDVPGLSPSLNEVRAYYRLLFEHPPGSNDLSLYEEKQKQLLFTQALARRDPAYPGGLVQGILFYQLGDPAAATTQTAAYLAEKPQGPWSLIAQTHLRQGIFELRGKF